MEHLRKQINGPLTLFLAENKLILNPNKVVGELYEENYNREDKMLYIMALLSNPYWFAMISQLIYFLHFSYNCISIKKLKYLFACLWNIFNEI